MKKGLVLALALVLGIIPAVFFAGTSYAGDFRSGTSVVVQSNETVDHTLFAVGNNIEIDGTVNGDIFCAGQNVTINATVNGDVLCAGMNIQIDGKVSGNIRAAGQIVTVSANVAHNASIVGNTVRTDAGSTVANDLQAAGNVLTFNGSVGRDADIAGTTTTIDGAIGRDVQAATDTLDLQSNAAIHGSLTYYSNNNLTRDNGSQVAGATTKKQPQQRTRMHQSSPVLNDLLSFLMLLALGLVLIALVPNRLNRLTDLALKKPLMTAAIGLAACIGVPALVLVSLFTVVGVFVGIVLLFGWIIVMILSAAFVSYYTGRLVLMKTPANPFLVMLTGVIIMSVLFLIPVVNVIAYILTALLGSGMVIRCLFQLTPKPTYEPVQHPKRANSKKN